MYLTVTRSVMQSCDSLTDWADVDGLVGITPHDETGEEWEPHEAISVHDTEGFASYSVPLHDPVAFLVVLEELSADDWRALKADPLFRSTPHLFQSSVRLLIAQDDAEAAEAAETEAQHAAEFRAWQDEQYGQGV